MRLPFLCLLALLSAFASAQVHVWTKRMGTGIREKAKFLRYAGGVPLCALESDGQVILIRFNRTTGDIVWRKVYGPGEIVGLVSNSLTDSYLLCNTPSGIARLFRINNADGAIVWQRPVLSDILSSPSHAVQLTKYWDQPTLIVGGERDGQAVVGQYDIFANEKFLLEVSGKSVTGVTYTNPYYASVGDGRAFVGQINAGVPQPEIEVTPSGRYVEQCEIASSDYGILRIAMISRDSQGKRYLDLRTPKNDFGDPDIFGTYPIPSGYSAKIFHDSGQYHSKDSARVPLQLISPTGTVLSRLVQFDPTRGAGFYETINLPYYQHEGGLSSVWLAATKRDFVMPGKRFYPDAGLNQEDIPVAQEGEYFLVTTVTGPNSSQARLMRILTIGPWNFRNVVGGRPAALDLYVSSPAVADFEIRLSVPPGSPLTIQPTFLVKKGDRVFTVPVVTRPVTRWTMVIFDVRYRNYKFQSAMTIFPPKASTLHLTPNYGRGGGVSMGRLVLTGPAPAGGFPATITESSGLIETPSTLTVPEGQSEVEFPIICHSPRATIAVDIHAEAGLASVTKTFTLLRPELTAVSTNVPSIKGGLSLATTVSLDSPAPGGGFVVDITATGAILPAVPVTVPTGQRSKIFTLRTRTVTTNTTSTVTASLNGRTRAVTVLVKP